MESIFAPKELHEKSELPALTADLTEFAKISPLAIIVQLR